ncbi:MAG: S8 family serine peptidase, partial [Phycisphaerae bacterium]|nr:S8 family serine peptidase [Phycisphaerae bacterium]
MNRKITFCLIATFLLTNLATAAPLRVPLDYPTIQAAINAAIDGDEIIVADGNYTPPNADGFDFGGKLITLKSQNGPQNCIINCNNTGRAFYFHNGETPAASVEGFTIKNGNAYYGGAIECEIASSPTINNCIITNNIAVYGGAIDCFYSSPVIKNCIIADNTADLDGGAIECGSESSPVINNCLIINNTAGGYGAIDCFDGSSPAITSCTMTDNTGDANLGGIYASGASSPAIINSILWDNGSSTGVSITYSCIQDTNVTGAGNIYTNPIFRKGPYFSYGNYYLSQIDANQFYNSPCINAGHGIANDNNDTNMPDSNHRITRTDNVPDSNIVDMGFHYPSGIDVNYVLITGVDPNGNYGTIDPCLPAPGRICKQFSDVRLTAVPDVNYHLEKWTGTNDDNSTDVNNIVTMDANHTVIAKFSSTVFCTLTTLVIDGNGTIDTYNAQPFVKHSVIDINAHPTPGYVVKRWLKGAAETFDINDANTYVDSNDPNTTYRLTLVSNTTVAVQFKTNPVTHLLNTSVIGGHGTISPRRSYQPEGIIVQLTATPDYGYRVKQWTGADNNSTDVNNIVTMNTNKTVTVEFEAIPQYQLIVDVNDPNMGSVDPNSGWFFENTVVTLTAIPGEGYRVKSWAGDANTWDKNTYTVTMNANKTIALAFEVDYSRVIHVFGDVNGIQAAINQAQNGDTIEIHPGTYNISTNIVVNKIITIVGDPEHPETVILDYQGEGIGAISIGSSGSPINGCTFNGFTIINLGRVVLTPEMPSLSSAGGPGTNGYPSGNNYGGGLTVYGTHNIKNCIIRDCAVYVNPGANGNPGHDPNEPNSQHGGNGGKGGNAGGAGIYIAWGDPNITNVLIENCRAEAGDGGNGGIAWNDPTKYPPGTFPKGISGYGGVGGDAFGAGIFCQQGSPKLTNVTIRNCIAISGNGGNGASGVEDVAGADGGVPGKTNGAGIYFSANSSPVLTNCTVENCIGYSGKGGNGGDAGLLYRNNWWPGGYGGLTVDSGANQGDLTRFTTKGGAVFCDNSSSAKFTNCGFTGNKIYSSVSGIGGTGTSRIGQSPPRKNIRMPDYGAGVFISPSSSPVFKNCRFESNRTAYNQEFEDPNYQTDIIDLDEPNLTDYYGEYTGRGGGLCLWYTLNSDINNCTFTLNSSPVGGGIYGEGSGIYINNCNITNNISMAGGGVLALDSVGTINKSTIKGNIAGTQTGYYTDTGDALFGTGGGIYVLSSLIDINDTFVTENYARLTGGGICFDGDTPFTQIPHIKNCLITANTATDEGGGIAAIYFAEPKIQNCTIAENIVSGATSNGGGLFASYAAEVIVKDTIFWANSGVDGSQIALTNGGPYTDMPAQLTVTYSDIDLREGTDFNSLVLEDGTGTGTTTGVLVDSQTINNEIAASGTAKVIVSLTEPAGAQTTDWSSSASVSTLRSQVATLQNQVLSIFSAGEFTLRQKLTNAAILSGQVTQAGLNKLMTNPAVAHIEPVRTVHPALAQAIPLANALDTRPIYNGSGVSVAIVDSGVDYTHPRLGGGGFPNSKVIGGYDTGNNDTDPMPVGEAHGTCCAGIAAGLLGTVGDYIGGVAYNAKIYALKLTTDEGIWPTDSTLAAWDWCITHRNDNPANPIRAMSNSWGVPGYPINNAADADAFSPAHTTAAQTAVDAGIAILAASGNDGFAGQGISWPSAMSNVISVGAVYDTTDRVTEYSNTANILDILAPADPVYTTDIVGAGGYNPGDYYPYFNGTSSACPFAAGSVAALQSAAMQLRGAHLTPSQVRTLLRITGDSVTDTKVAITKPRVNVGAAIALMSQAVPIYRETGSTITGLAQDANGTWIIDDHNNISKDPNFLLGFYLSSTEAMQNFNSPCFDIGSDTAANLNLNNYTTRTDGVKDSGIVDLGYHYDSGVPSYTLRVETDCNDANGTIEAPYIPGHTYNLYAGAAVRFHAIPDVNTRVAAWILDGVESETHNTYFNIVMNGPHTVTVRFESYSPGNLIVPDEYATIQEAIDAAVSGDTIYIYRKISGLPHYITDPNGFDFKGKAITIRSENPQDPNVVATTIIDCNNRGRAFIFQNGEDANSIIEGLTIINSLSAGAIAVGVRTDPIDPNRLSGIDATGNGFGGAIFIGRNTSPTIRYCVFSNCEVAGGIGSDGADGYNLFPDDVRNRGGGGNGGNGYGNGYGGAIFCDQNSSPTILACTISNSIAQGGIGGNGGTGGDGTTSKIGGDGGNGGNGSGRGYGGAIYAAANAKPKIVRCSFIENIASMGLGGQGGRQGPGQIPDDPPFAYDGYDGSSIGAGLSGAIYYEKGTTVDINDCNFINNTIEADTTGVYDTDGGAIYCEPNCAGISILKTNLTGNKATGGNGGAIRFGPKNNIKLADCYFGGNIADGNGGALIIGTLNDTNICRLDINNCAFTDNISGGTGGAIMAANFDANFIDCYINRNTALTGGGLYFTSNVSAARIYGGTIMQNKAIGANAEGGGAYISNMPLEIVNCQIIGNSSFYSGGGIMLKGPGTTTSKIHNCLFVGNSANARGGAIYISLNSSPKITSCTFSKNGCEPGGAGGAIFFAYNCSPTIKDCIFDQTKRVAIYANSADCDPNISYCLFNKNIPGDFYDYQTGITYDTNDANNPIVNLTALNNVTDGNNIAGNPNFLPSDLGNYYLSQIPPNASQSPAINHGSSLAVNVNVLPDDNMADYTTRTDSNDTAVDAGDAGQLDIGFHYIDIEPNWPRRFNLTTTAIDSHGDIEPPSGQYYAGTTIELTALPDAGWRVNKWTGTDNDSSTSTKNYVVMIRNRDVAVLFEQPKNLYVPGEYTSLQDAFNAAKNGDKIILARGTYYGSETNYDYSKIIVIGKNITITGTNPDDPCVVAQTILQGNGFVFMNVDSDMVLDGITIQDAHYYYGNIDCGLEGAHGPTGDGINGGSIFGGAIALYNASPTIRNCRFVRCSALASNGCSGTGEYGDGGWAGYAWGGAVGIDSTSNPIFKNCQFIDCYAQGSNGMNATGRWGHGGNWGDPNGGIYHTWDFGPYEDYWYYSGRGGAIYCMGGSKPQFEKCLFQGNIAYSGVCGISGSANIVGYPMEHYAIDSFGGAVYLAAGSEAKFTDCNFVNNEAHTRGQIAGSDPNVPNIDILETVIADTVLYDSVISYGGGICAEGTATPVFKGCTFNNNHACAGGGMYWENSIAHISRSTFENCIAMLGGAVSLIDSNSILFECDFSGNQAIDPVGQGGAIYSASSALKFYDCEFNANNASASGGAAYFTGELEPNMHNCLVIYNNAGRDGGGVSANWDTQLSLSNCTFSQNNATGIGFMASYGGGLSCAYQANTKIINSIFWNNRAGYGPEISIGSNFDAADKQTAEVTISYSDVKG